MWLLLFLKVLIKNLRQSTVSNRLFSCLMPIIHNYSFTYEFQKITFYYQPMGDFSMPNFLKYAKVLHSYFCSNMGKY